MTKQKDKDNKQTHYDLETLITSLVNNRAGQHNSTAQLKNKGIVAVNYGYNQEQRHHILQISAPAERTDKTEITSYVSTFPVLVGLTDVEALVKNVRTCASAMLQMVAVAKKNAYIDFDEMEKQSEKLRQAQQESKRQQLQSKLKREGSRGVSG